MSNCNDRVHYCEACGYDAPLSELNGYLCCWHMEVVA